MLPVPVDRWGVMLRVHRRHEFLPRIFHTLIRLGRGRECFLSIQADRISAAVADELENQLERLPNNWKHEVFGAHMPLVEHKENFMVALQAHYTSLLHLAENRLDAASLWDDDMWFETEGVRELREHLDVFCHARVEVRSAFLWDDEHVYNDAFPPHWQAILFRVLPGDTYPLDYTVHCPHQAAKGTCVRMKTRILNGGYMAQEHRVQSWDMYKRAGKIDAHTLTLVTDPVLQKVEE